MLLNSFQPENANDGNVHLPQAWERAQPQQPCTRGWEHWGEEGVADRSPSPSNHSLPHSAKRLEWFISMEQKGAVRKHLETIPPLVPSPRSHYLDLLPEKELCLEERLE